MLARRARLSWRSLLVSILALALALAAGLLACGGSSDDDATAVAPETAPPPAVPDEPAAPAPPAPPPETPQTPPAPPLPEPPAEAVASPAPEASPPTDEPTPPATAAAEQPDAPVEPPLPNAPAPPAAPRAPQAETTPLLYDTYDLSGAVAAPGHYAFLADPHDPTSAVTTYEGLRDGTATALLVHKADAHGVSQATLYDAVEPGDLFEWRQADDCFVRYQVTAVKPDPSGTVPRKHVGIAWTAYAFTGCAGTVATDTVASVSWDPSVNFLSPTISVPVRYGPYQIVPYGWTGALQEETEVTPPSSRDAGTAGGSDGPTWPSEDPAEVRQHPLWNEPALQKGWWLASIFADDWGIDADYRDDNGYLAARIWIARPGWRPLSVTTGAASKIGEVRTIDGHPAFLKYHAQGATAYIFNEATGIEYYAHLYASESHPPGRGIEDAITLARSLYR